MNTKEHFFKNVLPYFNIESYFMAGYMGQDVKIASFESLTSEHGKKVYDVLKTYAPLCNVVSFTDEYNVSAMSHFPEFADWCIANNVDIVTSSLDWDCDTEIEKQALKNLYEHGIIFVNCAGNEGKEIKFNGNKKTWHIDKEIITVSAIALDTQQKVAWSGYNYGEAVDICALGKNTIMLDEYENYYTASGTSFATPMLAAMLADYKSYVKKLTQNDVWKLIDKCDTTITYKGCTHKIFKLPKVVNNMIEDKDEKETSEWAKEARKNLMELGITDGTNPKGTITREEVWALLDRMYRLYQ